MEICLGGSLFNFLSLPTNRHGLCDDELMRVLSDVTQGTEAYYFFYLFIFII